MPTPLYAKLAEFAAERHGFVSAREARELLGIAPDTLRKMADRGQLERVAHGVYRVPLIPAGPLDSYVEAVRWPQIDRVAVSHESALNLYEMSDVNPDVIHLTVPAHYRPRREVPRLYELHREDLPPEAVTEFEGIPVATAATAVRQCRERLRPSLLAQAIDDGLRHGWLPRRQAANLRAELGLPHRTVSP